MKTIIPTLAALLAALFPAAADPIKPAPRPNIILLMTDDQGWGETGYNGHPHVKTPVLDQMAKSGLRVPALIEWPAVIKAPRTTGVPCVTTDILPTVLDLTGLSYPDPKRPLDGISLRPLIVEAAMKERPSPIGFWKYDAREEKKNPRWVDAELSRGTTPTAHEDHIDFTNYRHTVAKTKDFGGAAVWMDNRYKLST